MMSEEHIVGRLEELGYKGADVRTALRDVGKVIVARAAAAYVARLPESEQATLKGLSETDLQTYLAQHQYSFPRMPQEEFERMHDETWEDYFRSMAS
jgi:hypothetical protein